MNDDTDDEPTPCSCGDVETVELHSPDGRQTILVCATCGSDEP